MTDLSCALTKYRNARLVGASAYDLLMQVYSEAISNCYQENVMLASRALRTLQQSLDHKNQGELAVNLDRVYNQCLRLISCGDFYKAASMLAEIRDAWREAYSLSCGAGTVASISGAR